MAESLRQKQSRFARAVPLLLQYMTALGYEYTLGQAKRTEAEAQANAAAGTGIAKSLHIVSLAIDINLFKDGQYLDSSDAHRPFGVFWKSLGEDYYWGGDFSKPDGNHYSVGHEGRK